MNNIFLVYTEHQYKSIIHSIKHFNITKNKAVLFVFVENKRNMPKNSWIKNLLTDGLFKKTFVIEEWSVVNSIIRGSKSAKYFVNILNSFSNSRCRLFSPIYNSDSVNLAHNILNPYDLIILDDGNASFSVIVQRKNKNTYNFTYSLLSSFFHRRNMLKSIDEITYFTKYNLPSIGNDNIIKYEEEVKKNLLKLDNNCVIILGSTIYIAPPNMKSIIDPGDYFNTLAEIRNKFKSKSITYYAHRYENEESLDSLSKFGFEIVKNNKPFEKMFKDFEICPHIIMSFGSPILDNLTRMYEKTPRLITIRMDLSKYRRARLDFELIYKDFENNKNLEIINHNKINEIENR